jgi:hypothetical protein
LDCDPKKDKSCKSGKFLEGILENNGGELFDIVSFHGYTPYSKPSSGVGGLYADENHPKWKHRGGVVLGKIDFVRETLNSYDLDQPIFHSEGSLNCLDCDPTSAAFLEAQADYVVWLYIRNWVNGITSTIWYQLEGPGWRSGGLLDGNQDPKPVYYALQFMAQQLDRATYIGRVYESTPVAGYKFSTFQKEIWVLWSPDETPHSITLPSSFDHVFDKYGVEINMTNNQLEVSNPVYVEFNQ